MLALQLAGANIFSAASQPVVPPCRDKLFGFLLCLHGSMHKNTHCFAALTSQPARQSTGTRTSCAFHRTNSASSCSTSGITYNSDAQPSSSCQANHSSLCNHKSQSVSSSSNPACSWQRVNTADSSSQVLAALAPDLWSPQTAPESSQHAGTSSPPAHCATRSRIAVAAMSQTASLSNLNASSTVRCNARAC